MQSCSHSQNSAIRMTSQLFRTKNGQGHNLGLKIGPNLLRLPKEGNILEKSLFYEENLQTTFLKNQLY